MVHHVEGFAKIDHSGTNQLALVHCPSPVLGHGDKNILGGVARSDMELTLVQDRVNLEVVLQLLMQKWTYNTS